MENDLVNVIKRSGIIGAGGAGFPTHIKIDTKCDYVIINGAECEPLLDVDKELMAKKAKEILKTLNLIVESTNSKKGIIGLKSKYKEAIKNLKDEMENYSKIEICELGNFYPAGDEQVLVYETTKRIVPEGGIPLDVGCVVINVETLVNIHNGYEKNTPVIKKYVTVTGEIENPKTLLVPIGLSIKEVLKLCGGVTVEKFEIINGGPMMGKLLDNIENEYITKTSKGLIILPENHKLVLSKKKKIETILKEAKTSCMHCNMCTEVCPRNLIGHNIYPHKLIRIASYNNICDKDTSLTTAYLCCECGLCEYACNMNLQPWKLHNNIKNSLRSHGIKNDNLRKIDKVNEFIQYKKYPITKLIRQLGLGKYVNKLKIEEVSIDKIKEVTILLKQGIGKKTSPLVKIGDRVKEGQIIGDLDDKILGSKIHSSIDGIVKQVNENNVVVEKIKEIEVL